MKQKIGFGTALPDGGWQFMATKDPHPRIPWSHKEEVPSAKLSVLIAAVCAFIVASIRWVL